MNALRPEQALMASVAEHLGTLKDSGASKMVFRFVAPGDQVLGAAVFLRGPLTPTYLRTLEEIDETGREPVGVSALITLKSLLKLHEEGNTDGIRVTLDFLLKGQNKITH